jgi:hypothetical protein
LIIYYNYYFCEPKKNKDMLLEGILSIAGQQGLFKLVSKGKHNVIVESLITKKRMPAFSTSRISTLEDVAVYTEDGDIPLKDVFVKIFGQYGAELNISNKSSAKELENFMTEVLPNYDKERVYQSDIKKLVNWYKQLIEYDIINSESIEKEKASENNENNITDESQESLKTDN